MTDRRKNKQVEQTLDHIAFVAIMRGIPAAFADLDAHKIDRAVLWRLLGDPARRRSRERRLRPSH